MQVIVGVEVLSNADSTWFPEYMTEGAAGADLRAAVDSQLIIAPMGRAIIPTGLKLAIPCGYEGQVRPRSGLAARHGVTLLNSPGTIDSDYRGEVKVILVNLGDEPFHVERGERVAQLVIAPVTKATFTQESRPEKTARDEGGFGHTGR